MSLSSTRFFKSLMLAGLRGGANANLINSFASGEMSKSLFHWYNHSLCSECSELSDLILQHVAFDKRYIVWINLLCIGNLLKQAFKILVLIRAYMSSLFPSSQLLVQLRVYSEQVFNIIFRYFFSYCMLIELRREEPSISSTTPESAPLLSSMFSAASRFLVICSVSILSIKLSHERIHFSFISSSMNRSFMPLVVIQSCGSLSSSASLWSLFFIWFKAFVRDLLSKPLNHSMKFSEQKSSYFCLYLVDLSLQCNNLVVGSHSVSSLECSICQWCPIVVQISMS